MKIILVGMPGSGKSTFGKQLARQLNFVFFDLDRIIVEETGKSISQIFELDGEGKFRELETIYLEKYLKGMEGFVLATGGGTPCFNDNMDLINKTGISVYLDVSLEEIYKRIPKNQTGKRPMFTGLDEGEIILKLKNLHTDREPFYRQSKIILSGSEISIEYLMSELLTYFKN